MTVSKEFRLRAWDALKGRYWRAFGVCLLGGIIVSACASVSSFSQGEIQELSIDPARLCICGIIGLLLMVFIAIPVTIGIKNYFLKNAEGYASFSELFSGFKNAYGKNIKTMVLVDIKIFLWTLLLIVPGIIKSYEYSAIPYILAENPGISSKEAFLLSKKIMTGNKWRLFKLQFSFIGWLLLACLTLGIGAFFLEPYVEAAYAEFYREVKNI